MDQFGAADPMTPIAAAVPLWLLSLLCTIVVWPWRELTGRWPVVAYPARAPGEQRRIDVRGRKEAKALAEHWKAEIEKTGQPESGLMIP